MKEQTTPIIAATRSLAPLPNGLAVWLLTTWIPSNEDKSEAVIFTFCQIDTSSGGPLEHKDTVICNRVAALSWSNCWGHRAAGCTYPGHHFREQKLCLTAGHMLPSSPCRNAREELSLPNSYTLKPRLIRGQSARYRKSMSCSTWCVLLSRRIIFRRESAWCFDLIVMSSGTTAEASADRQYVNDRVNKLSTEAARG